MTSTKNQVYKPLDPDLREIRVLQVEQGSGNDPIRCSLNIINLSVQPVPAYESISYAWGDPSKRENIILHNEFVSVPASSAAVLRRMRHTNSNRTIWIDAVCINQGDLVDRGHQVGMMDIVYANSKLNLIWLGEADDTIPRAIASIRMILEAARHESNDFTDFATMLYDHTGALHYSNTGFNIDFDIKAVLELYSKAWFSRLWVVQEASLAPCSVVFCGDFELDLNDILRVACWIHYKQNALPVEVGSCPGIMTAGLMAKSADHVYGVYNAVTSTDEAKPGMLRFLEDLRDFDTREAKDHIYGLLGLYKKYVPNKKLPLSLVKPDYTTPVIDCLRDATRVAIEERLDLATMPDISHRTGALSTGKSLSWVTRWDNKWDQTQDPLEFELFFSADGGRRMLEADLSSEPDPDVLVLRGFLVSNVRAVLPVIRSQTLRTTQSVEDLLNSIVDIHRQTNSGNTNNRKLQEDLALTLMAGIDTNHEILNDTEGVSRFQAFKQHMIQHKALPPPVEDASLAGDDQSVARLAADFLQAMRNACINRSLFVTANDMVGVGPQIMQSGDLVAVLFGSQLPAILRPRRGSDEYEFVGITYVHGMMHGEVVLDLEKAGKEATIIRLR